MTASNMSNSVMHYIQLYRPYASAEARHKVRVFIEQDKKVIMQLQNFIPPCARVKPNGAHSSPSQPAVPRPSTELKPMMQSPAPGLPVDSLASC